MGIVDERCAKCLVRHQALCASLMDNELSVLGDIGRSRALDRGQVLIWAGDDSDVCANLVSGVLQMTIATNDGREQIVGLLFPGDFVGQPFAVETTLTFAALTEAELCVYPRKAFVGILAEHAALERLLFHRTMAALDDARAWMLTLGRRSAGEKVAGFLIELSERLPCRTDLDGVSTFELPLSRAQIANVLGLTIETVSRQITKLKDARAITTPGRRMVAIIDPELLLTHAETVHN